MSEKVAELEKAKDAVRWLLDHANGLVDMHGLAYWARRVEAIRDEIKGTL
ncbi:hypothetical protein SEA_ALEEMILY_141 [Gordonia phage Aleemily]|uniref:Uncharacterized protein n=1 Tax=Gordonia phage Aleemily TaxID=2965181 RepID=A0A9E7QCP0_9CAUD|nr:hypothetical protein SEA_ALEEMILY_141 [Gordonia phage Aleemily]